MFIFFTGCDTACGIAHECIQICHKTPTGPKCGCNPGFTLSENGKSCDDIDECKVDSKICNHYCQNTKGSFKCTCHDEYSFKSGKKNYLLLLNDF